MAESTGETGGSPRPPSPSPPQPGGAPIPGGPFPSGGSFGATVSGGPPDWVIFGGGLLLVGAFAEILTGVSKRAGIAFALLVVMGYAATGGKLENAVSLARKVGLVAGK